MVGERPSGILNKNPKTGRGFMNLVAEALGLPLETEKLVIEATAGELLRIYIVAQAPPDDKLPVIIQVVKDAFVEEDATVVLTPHVVTRSPRDGA